MKGRYLRGFLFITAITGNVIAFAQQRHEFSVQQAIDYARKNNSIVKNTLLSLRNQEQVNREITAQAFPQITGSVNGGYNPNVTVQQFPNFIAAATYGVLQAEGVKNGTGSAIVPPADFGFIAAQFGSKYNASYGVSLNQTLFDGQVFVGLQARKTSINFFEKTVEVTDENIKANVYKIYYQLAASKSQLELLDANIVRLQRLRRDAEILFNNGFGEKLDINRADVQLANVETEKLKALNNIANGYLGLKTLLGMPIRDTLVLTDSVTYDNIKDGVLENLAYNYNDRKEYQLAELGLKLRQYDVKRYQLTYFPVASLSGSYNRIAQSNKFNFFGGAKWFPSSNVGVNISIPIFDGFAKSARVQQARIRLQQSQNDIDSLKIGIDREVNQALNNYKSAIATLDNQKRNIDLAGEVYNQTILKQREGQGSQTEITSAQADLQVAQNNYILSLYDAINAKVDFLKATGKLQ
jgi:outer membrane protein TolC